MINNPCPEAFALELRPLETVVGELHVCTPKHDERCAENHYKDLLEYKLNELVRPGDVVCEIGTGCGIIPTVLFRWFGHTVEWHGCEPCWVNYMCTAGTLLANGAHSYARQLDFCGLHTVAGTLRFGQYAGSAAGSNQGNMLDFGFNNEAPVLLPTQWQPMRRCDVLILDCEGSEHWLAPHLPHCRVIVGEIHDTDWLRRDGWTYEATLDELKKHAGQVIMPQLVLS